MVASKRLIEPVTRPLSKVRHNSGKTILFLELGETYRSLLEKASEAKTRSYSPYSGFRVGAAGLTLSGQSFSGANIENASYRLTQCAEEAAIAVVNSAGFGSDLIAVAITARAKDSDTKKVTNPCGACLQMILEHAKRSGIDIEILLATTRFDKIILTSISSLLKINFDPNDLGVEITPKGQ